MLTNEKVPTIPAANELWLHFATNTEECMTSLRSITTVLSMAMHRMEIEEPDLPAISWLVYMQQTLINCIDEKLGAVQYRIENEKE